MCICIYKYINKYKYMYVYIFTQGVASASQRRGAETLTPAGATCECGHAPP